MKLIKRIPLTDGAYEEIVLTESLYSDELRSRGRRAALEEGVNNPVWIYPMSNGKEVAEQLLYADGRQTFYAIQP